MQNTLKNEKYYYKGLIIIIVNYNEFTKVLTFLML